MPVPNRHAVVIERQNGTVEQRRYPTKAQAEAARDAATTAGDSAALQEMREISANQ